MKETNWGSKWLLWKQRRHSSGRRGFLLGACFPKRAIVLNQGEEQSWKPKVLQVQDKEYGHGKAKMDLGEGWWPGSSKAAPFTDPLPQGSSPRVARQWRFMGAGISTQEVPAEKHGLDLQNGSSSVPHLSSFPSQNIHPVPSHMKPSESLLGKDQWVTPGPGSPEPDWLPRINILFGSLSPVTTQDLVALWLF